MFNLRYKGKICVPSHDALKDMARHDVPPSLVEIIILEGEDYADKFMTKGEIGRAVQKDKFTTIVKLVPSYSYSTDEDVWVIKHIGKKRRMR